MHMKIFMVKPLFGVSYHSPSKGVQGSIQTSTFGPPSAVGRQLSGYFEFKHTNIMLTAVTKWLFSDGPKYQHLQLVIAISNSRQ
jgi:hypothetical protein